MAFVSAPDGTEIYYEDVGRGQPLVFIHGWPMSGAMWEYQIVPLVAAGFRCISYDRRGFGRSGKSGTAYDYATLGSDLAALIAHLQLNDVTLVGFSMGGGEVMEVLTKHNADGRVARAVLAASIVPFMLRTEDNPEGVAAQVFKDMQASLQADRPAFLTTFMETFYGVGLLSSPVSMPMLAAACEVAMTASPIATLACVTSFSSTDYRAACRQIDKPVLVLHGDSDKIVPIEIAGKRAAELIPQAELEIYDGGAHAIFYSHRQRMAQDIAAFASEGRIVIEPPV